MENYGEASLSEFLHVMRGFLDGRIDARGYRESIFALTKQRINIGESESRILQQAYGDADDYDPEVRLAYTIDESELRRRVSRVVEELAAIGHSPSA